MKPYSTASITRQAPVVCESCGQFRFPARAIELMRGPFASAVAGYYVVPVQLGVCVCPVYALPGLKGVAPCASGSSGCCLPFDLARRINRIVPRMPRATAARTPITIPAMAPPPIPLDDEGLSVGIIEEVLVEIGEAIADEGDVWVEVGVLATAFRTCRLPPDVISKPVLT